MALYVSRTFGVSFIFPFVCLSSLRCVSSEHGVVEAPAIYNVELCRCRRFKFWINLVAFLAAATAPRFMEQ